MAITTEQALDMLPHVVDLYDKLDMDTYRKSLQEKNGTADVTETGVTAFKYILKNIGKAKEEVYAIIGISSMKPIEEIKAQSLAKTLAAFKDILGDKETMDFFKSAMR